MALSLHRICMQIIPLEIDQTTKDIKAALWRGDIEEVRTLISKRMGLRVCVGEHQVRLSKRSGHGLAAEAG
jgi:hypothetical protein